MHPPSKLLKFVIYSSLGLLIAAWAFVLFSPLEGIHRIRQADTLFAAYSYCTEGAEFLRPRIAHRGNTEGIAIGEFPLVSYIFSLKCQITGVWDEVSPKLLNFLFFLLAGLFWGLWLKKRSYQDWQGWGLWFFVFLGATQAQLHWAIPLPDIFVVMILGLGAYLHDESKINSVISSLLFIIAFAVRPYYIPFLFLFAGWPWRIATVAVCGGIYLFWYKHWILQSQVDYYNTKIFTLQETFHVLPQTLLAWATQFVRNHLNVVGLIPFVLFLKNEKRDIYLFGLVVISTLMVVFIKADHLINHGYYLGAAALFTSLIVYRGLSELNDSQKMFFCLVYFLVLVANVQHHWRQNSLQEQNKALVLREAMSVPETAKVATYLSDYGNDATYLYWIKRTGWSLAESLFDANKPCPQGAQYYMIRRQNELALEACSQTEN